MRFIFFIINSAIFILYSFFIFAILGELIPLTSKINESQLYAQTLITIEFVDTVFIATLWSFFFSIIIALIIGVYSRKPTDKLDRKILFSKKGFLVNTSLVVTLFMGIVLVDLGSSRINSDSEFANKEVEAIHELYKTKKTILLPFVSNETPESFSKRLNDSKGKDFNQLLEIRYRDECSNDNIDKVEVYSFASFEFLMVGIDKIDETIRLFNRSYKKDYDRCRAKEIRAGQALIDKDKARWKNEGEANRLKREQADDLCNIVNGTRNGC
jgi:hypothetical protein